MTGKYTGVCKFFKEDKGFGFIVRDDGQGDVFVHKSALAPGDSLGEGDKVSFDVEPSKKPGKGPQATNVEVL